MAHPKPLDNRFHVHLERFIHFLHPFGYRLSDLMEPHRRVNVTRQDLRGIRCANAIFMLEVDAPRLRADGEINGNALNGIRSIT